MKIWIFIGRMQPLHLWHQKIIEKSIKSNDFTFIFLWSSWIINEYNPFTDSERKKFITNIFSNKEKYKLINLADSESDELWLKEIEKKVKQNIKQDIKKVTFYWWDFENDYAIKVVKQYLNILDFKEILFEEINRHNIYINHNWQKILISSTQVRKSLSMKDYEILKKLLDDRIYEIIIKKIKSHYEIL